MKTDHPVSSVSKELTLSWPEPEIKRLKFKEQENLRRFRHTKTFSIEIKRGPAPLCSTVLCQRVGNALEVGYELMSKWFFFFLPFQALLLNETKLSMTYTEAKNRSFQLENRSSLVPRNVSNGKMNKHTHTVTALRKALQNGEKKKTRKRETPGSVWRSQWKEQLRSPHSGRFFRRGPVDVASHGVLQNSV